MQLSFCASMFGRPPCPHLDDRDRLVEKLEPQLPPPQSGESWLSPGRIFAATSIPRGPVSLLKVPRLPMSLSGWERDD